MQRFWGLLPKKMRQDRRHVPVIEQSLLSPHRPQYSVEGIKGQLGDRNYRNTIQGDKYKVTNTRDRHFVGINTR